MSVLASWLIVSLSVLVGVFYVLWRRAVQKARTYKEVADWSFGETQRYAAVLGNVLLENQRLRAELWNDVHAADWWREGKNPEAGDGEDV
jgi:hypothetical protein